MTTLNFQIEKMHKFNNIIFGTL